LVIVSSSVKILISSVLSTVFPLALSCISSHRLLF
jgi:hypothetical protein